MFERVVFTISCFALMSGVGSPAVWSQGLLIGIEAFEGRQTWQNLTRFEQAQDYIKNLDYDWMQNDSLGRNAGRLCRYIRLISEGRESLASNFVREFVDTLDKANYRQLYQFLDLELMDNAGQYREAVKRYALDSSHRVFQLSQLPDEEISFSDSAIGSQLYRSPFGQPIAEVQINGRRIKAWLDTGAELTVLSHRLARQCGIKSIANSELTIGTTTSIELKSRLAVIDELKLGEVILRHHPVILLDEDELTFDLDTMQVKMEAIVGWPAIRQIRLELDDRNNRYRASKSEAIGGKERNMFWLGYPAVKVMHPDGQSLIFVLDTGLNDTELKPNIYHKLSFDNIRMDSVKVGGAGGFETKMVREVENVSLVVSGLRFDFRELSTSDIIDLVFIHQDGTLGADLLNDTRLVIDYPNRLFEVFDD